MSFIFKYEMNNCWVVVFFAVKEQSFDCLVEVDRLNVKSIDESSRVDGQVEVEVIDQEFDVDCLVEVDQLSVNLTDESSQVDGQVEVEVINQEVEVEVIDEKSKGRPIGGRVVVD
jgi:hypothetical protein